MLRLSELKTEMIQIVFLVFYKSIFFTKRFEMYNDGLTYLVSLRKKNEQQGHHGFDAMLLLTSVK